MTLTAGLLSPERAVPSSIERPEYVGQIAPLPYRGSFVRDDETIAATCSRTPHHGA